MEHFHAALSDTRGNSSCQAPSPEVYGWKFLGLKGVERSFLERSRHSVYTQPTYVEESIAVWHSRAGGGPFPGLHHDHHSALN